MKIENRAVHPVQRGVYMKNPDSTYLGELQLRGAVTRAIERLEQSPDFEDRRTVAKLRAELKRIEWKLARLSSDTVTDTH